MVAVNPDLLFMFSARHPPRNPNPNSPNLKHSPNSLPTSLNVHPIRPQSSKTLNLQSNGRPIAPFCFLLPILHSFKRLIASRDRKIRSFLGGGLGDDLWIDGRDLTRSCGIGTLLMSSTAASKAKVSPFLWALATNPTFVSGLLAWAIAQAAKVFLNFFVERRWDFVILVSSGGMPSSHSALCTALTTAVALCHGVGDSLFPVCLGFSLIVMYDAIGVRRHAGMHAEVLNKIVEDLFQGHPISQRKLKELLGHTPSQVIAGALLGILVAYLCCQGCVVAV